MNRRLHRASFGLLALGLIAWEASAAVPAASEAELLFAHRIQPLFKAKCMACHGDDEAKLKGGFDLRTREAMLAGGDSEKPSVVAGKPVDRPAWAPYYDALQKQTELSAPKPVRRQS